MTREGTAMEKKVGRLVGLAGQNPLPLCFVAGYALCRACSEVPIALASFSFAAEEIGKLVGIALAVLLGYIFDREREQRALTWVPHAALLAGCALVALCGTVDEEGFGVGKVASFILGAGSSMAMMQWLELCGMLASKQIAIAVTATFLLGAAVSFVTPALGNNAVAGVAMLLLSGTSAALLAICERNAGVRSTTGSYQRSLPGNKAGLVLPVDVVLWVTATSLTFSIVESRGTGVLMGTAVHSAGTVVPCVIVLLCYWLIPDKFDMRLLYIATLPLLITALAIAGNTGVAPSVPGLFLSIGVTASRIIMYSTVIIRAYQCGVSSLLGCAAVMFLNISLYLCQNSLLIHLEALVGPDIFLVSALLVESVLVVLLIMRENDRMASMDALPGVGGRAAAIPTVDTLMRTSGLSPRERTVFARMAQGETTTQISNSLFISQGAVRSHASHIYEKLGVHSRQELDDLVAACRDAQTREE